MLIKPLPLPSLYYRTNHIRRGNMGEGLARYHLTKDLNFWSSETASIMAS